MDLVQELKQILEGEVDDSTKTREAYSRDASLFRVVPQVVVRPKHTQDVQALVRFVSEKRKNGEDISLTARAAGTDMSGGPLTPSIVVDMLPHFNRTIEVGRDYAIVDPGVYYRDFDRETKNHKHL